MKTTALALTFALSTSAAFASGMAEPVMEQPTMSPAVVEEQTGTSAQGIVVPLLLLVLVAAVVSN